MTVNPAPRSNNEVWGFFGTIRHNADPIEAWTIAMEGIAKATGCAEYAVRDFLDSGHGRHLADDVSNNLIKGIPLHGAIDVAVKQWMTWKIGRRTSRETGIPPDLPYLLGFVLDGEILAESEGH
jgi:hypothetical protein